MGECEHEAAVGCCWANDGGGWGCCEQLAGGECAAEDAAVLAYADVWPKSENGDADDVGLLVCPCELDEPEW